MENTNFVSCVALCCCWCAFLPAHLLVQKAFGYPGYPGKVRYTEVLTWGFDGGWSALCVSRPAHPQLIGVPRWRWWTPLQEVGVKVRYFQNGWDSILLSLQRGDDFDVALNGIEITPDKEQAVLFSRPYFVYTGTDRRPRHRESHQLWKI